LGYQCHCRVETAAAASIGMIGGAVGVGVAALVWCQSINVDTCGLIPNAVRSNLTEVQILELLVKILEVRSILSELLLLMWFFGCGQSTSSLQSVMRCHLLSLWCEIPSETKQLYHFPPFSASQLSLAPALLLVWKLLAWLLGAY
jgi:hypothetical protein